MLKNLIREIFTEEIPVGKLPKELVDQAKFIGKKEQTERERIQKIVNERIQKIIKDTEEEFKDIENKLKKDHDDIWDKIHSHLETPFEDRKNYLFNLNYPTRMVTKIVPIEGSEEILAKLDKEKD